MKPTEQSELVQTVREFVDWAHAMGWLYDMVPLQLAHFVRFLEQRGVERFEHVDTTLLLEYKRSLLLTRGPSTVNGYLTALRALWRYLLREELVRHNATEGVAPARLNHFRPHLYSEQELSRIEKAMQAKIEQARIPGRRFGRRTQQAAIGLLRDCGLRVSEACHLNMSDYDPRQRSLRIERTKFFKTRVIPLPRSTCFRLDRYLEHRQRWVSPTTESPALFISMLRRRLDRGGFEKPFNQLLSELSIYQPRRQQGRSVFGSTNLHALRHTYAVRALERWQRQGRNVEHLLPLLSAYMGHVHVSYTTHYLHLTPVLMQLANERFAQFASRLDHSDGSTDGE